MKIVPLKYKNLRDTNNFERYFAFGFKSLNSKSIFSTEEQTIGTWIDGKTICRKCISSTIKNNNEVQFTISDIDSVLNMYGTVEDPSGNYSMINSFFEGTRHCSFYYSPGIGFKAQTGSAFIGYSYNIIVEYTKTVN